MNGIGEGVHELPALSAPENSQLVQSSTASFVAPFVERERQGSGLLVLWLLSSVWLHEVGRTVGRRHLRWRDRTRASPLTEDVLYVGSAAAHGGTQAFALYLGAHGRRRAAATLVHRR
jgi:hypothetical protein